MATHHATMMLLESQHPTFVVRVWQSKLGTVAFRWQGVQMAGRMRTAKGGCSFVLKFYAWYVPFCAELGVCAGDRGQKSEC